MDKLESITIENNEQYLRQSSKKVDISDPELHNNIVVLQDYCVQNDVMAMAAVQLGIPKRIVYVKNTNLEILNKRLTDEGKEETKDYNEAKVLINPEIISREGLTTFWEACASCSWYEGEVKKWYNGKVKRPYKIRVRYFDLEGTSLKNVSFSTIFCQFSSKCFLVNSIILSFPPNKSIHAIGGNHENPVTIASSHELISYATSFVM